MTKLSLLSPSRPIDPWYWRWVRPILFVVGGLLVVAVAGQGLVTVIETSEAAATHTAGATFSALWDNFVAGLTTGPALDRVVVAVAGALALVAQLGKLISLGGGLLLCWELTRLIGRKAGAIQTVEHSASRRTETDE